MASASKVLPARNNPRLLHYAVPVMLELVEIYLAIGYHSSDHGLFNWLCSRTAFPDRWLQEFWRKLPIA